jgi:DNA-binding MarR family transcriptional regulator
MKPFHELPRKGFTKIDNAVFTSGLAASELAVYVVVKSHDFGRRTFRLSYRQLAAEAGMSRHTAIRTVASLVKMGALTRERSDGRDANLFRCVAPPRYRRQKGDVVAPHR